MKNNNKSWSPKSEKTSVKKYNYVNANEIRGGYPSSGDYKKNTFMDAMKQTRENIYNPNFSITENGAVGYSTTGNALLDLNFAVSSLRGKDDSEIVDMFRKAFNENPVYAMRWLFFARDAREGLGERRLFRICLKDMANNGMSESINALIPVIAEYGRFDDMWELLDIPACNKAVIKAIKSQMKLDNAEFVAGGSVSLMAKWLPSENTSSEKTKHYANVIRKSLNMTPKQYRQWLSRMRKYVDVVERKMSSDNWQAIDYETVPSKANLIYKNAFLKHDAERRKLFLEALDNGEAKINSSVNFPHDIVHKYMMESVLWNASVGKYDSTLEGMWKALPDTVKGCGNTMVVADGSGSMEMNKVGQSKTLSVLDVANALAIYFSEHSSGQFKDKYITFSSTPQFVDFSSANSLHDKLKIALQHDECSNTNIEAVFDLILKTAIDNHMSQEEIPQNILIISDMEFDECTNCRSARYATTLFDMIKQKYERNGYMLPRLVFWNVYSRTNTIPVRENELGVALVSGFSPNVAKMVMSGKLDPMECLIEAISAPRYDVVEKLLKS